VTVALVSLKAYFGHARTLEWFEGLARLVEAGRAEGVRVVLAPAATALASLAPRAEELGIELAAQDCSVHPAGAWTGELPASLLAELGARHVMVGHVERRRLGEDDAVVAAKVEAAVAAGLGPVLCVGEPEEGPPAEAARYVLAQLEAARLPEGRPALVAYEPVWAVGADRPAPAAHVRAVLERLAPWRAARPEVAVVYGGTAGPGTVEQIRDVVDGLGLGRRVHDVPALAEVLDELRSSIGGTP